MFVWLGLGENRATNFMHNMVWAKLGNCVEKGKTSDIKKSWQGKAATQEIDNRLRCSSVKLL